MNGIRPLPVLIPSPPRPGPSVPRTARGTRGRGRRPRGAGVRFSIQRSRITVNSFEGQGQRPRQPPNAYQRRPAPGPSREDVEERLRKEAEDKKKVFYFKQQEEHIRRIREHALDNKKQAEEIRLLKLQLEEKILKTPQTEKEPELPMSI